MAGSLVNNGTVAPGNSPGTLRIGRNFQQNANGSLVMEIASPENFDVLNVGGKVRLDGRLAIDNDSPLELGQFKLIQAKGPISGNFDSITFTRSQDTRARFIVSDGTGTLVIAPGSYLHKVSEQLTLIPEASVFWQHEFLRDSETLQATLNQGSGGDFAHQVSDSDGDSVFGGVALGFQTNFGFYGNISYDIEIGRESELNHTLTVSADWRF